MTAKRRHVEADMDAVIVLRRRVQLGWMVEEGSRVRVTNPSGGTWTGVIVALSDAPAMLLERDDGRRVMLPQCFEVGQVRAEEGEDEDRGADR